jgi:hypothetical protein
LIFRIGGKAKAVLHPRNGFPEGIGMFHILRGLLYTTIATNCTSTASFIIWARMGKKYLIGEQKNNIELTQKIRRTV